MRNFIYSIRFRVLFIMISAIALQFWLTMSFALETWNKQSEGFSKKMEGLLLKEIKKGESYFLRTLYRGTFLYKQQKDIEGMQNYLRSLRGIEGVESLRIFKDTALKKYSVAYDGDPSRQHRLTYPLDCLACHPGVGNIGERKIRLLDTWFYNEAKGSVNLAGDKSLLFITHIYSSGNCTSCHDSKKKVLGVMQANFATKEFEKLSKETKESFASKSKHFQAVFVYAAIATFVFSTLLAYVLINGMLVNKLRKIKYVLDQLSFGNTDVNVNVIPKSKDEIGALKESLELMVRAINFLK